ncbi:hypothetical protein P280DRAFT_96256 [Massarina eburnea CBS 473.64]|uniref:Uncharacterized protein n=1 Tax=Massarina eburnea CBS 473.64 TaxID=1395130 RepID=A0A6A6RSY9_9PLEO|nr:hypothetical protein P280DRAFT_96256 [Massarina eburnea CBS 473.64]
MLILGSSQPSRPLVSTCVPFTSTTPGRHALQRPDSLPSKLKPYRNASDRCLNLTGRSISTVQSLSCAAVYTCQHARCGARCFSGFLRWPTSMRIRPRCHLPQPTKVEVYIELKLTDRGTCTTSVVESKFCAWFLPCWHHYSGEPLPCFVDLASRIFETWNHGPTHRFSTRCFCEKHKHAENDSSRSC